MKKVTIWKGTTKEQLVKICFDNDLKKLSNIDYAIPLDYLNAHPEARTYWLIMDYNRNPIFGEVRNLKEIAQENKVQLTFF